VKVYIVDVVEESISVPFTLRVYLQQTVAALKDQVAAHLSCDVERIRCVLDVHSDLRLLDEPERSLKLVGFGKNNKVCRQFFSCCVLNSSVVSYVNAKLSPRSPKNFGKICSLQMHSPDGSTGAGQYQSTQCISIW